ncbi:MAG: hypothetical protein H6745_14550 [Deltaproteobacteria bacterium]|nr:hypothetical protein [Deltaproteobacteria bacterium]
MTAGVVAAVTGPMAQFLRYESRSVVTNMLILLGYAFLVLGAATLLAILVGDLWFPGRWRERVILGRRVAPIDASEADDPIKALRAQKSYFLQFSALVAVFVGLAVFAFQKGTGFSLEESYQRTTLRSDSVEPKLELVSELGEQRRDDRVPQALEILDSVWRDETQPLEVRRAALTALGQVGDYLSDAVDRWREQGRRTSWQGETLTGLRASLAPALRKFHETAPPSLRAYVTYVLGAIHDDESRALFLNDLKAFPDESSDEHRTALLALGVARQLEALPDVAALANDGKERDDDTFALLAWVARELMFTFQRYYQKTDEDDIPEEMRAAAERLWRYYGEVAATGAAERRCTAAVVLTQARDVRLREVLFRAFDAPGAGEIICGYARVTAVTGTVRTLGEDGQELRQRLIDALALVSLGDDVVTRWARDRLMHVSDDSENVRYLLNDLLAKLGQPKVTGTPVPRETPKPEPEPEPDAGAAAEVAPDAGAAAEVAPDAGAEEPAPDAVPDAPSAKATQNSPTDGAPAP